MGLYRRLCQRGSSDVFGLRRVLLRAFIVPAAWPFRAGAQPSPPAGESMDPSTRIPLRFGVLPIGGTLDSRNHWAPLLADLERALSRPITMFSANSYGALMRAIARDEVDLAFLSGRMALEAVMQHGMRVVAQVTRRDGLPGYRAILLTRSTGPRSTLEELLADPGSWRLARGEKYSMSGFIVPQLEFFAPHGIAMETRFAGEIVGTHQRIALAVANGEADLATSNTADFERFTLQFPAEASRLHVIWASDLIPHGQIVIRSSLAPQLRAAVQEFFAGYGRGSSARAAREREALASLHDLAGFVVADNRSLLPAARIEYRHALEQASKATWINDAAREKRLQRVEAEYEARIRALTAD